MTEKSEHDAMVEQLWRTVLTEGVYGKERRKRRFFRLLRGHPRCKNCFAPFQGAGSRVARLIYKTRPSNVNPRLCNACEEFARQHQGGAEVELSLLFADVWYVSRTLTQLGFEFRVENARFIDWNQRLLQDSQLLGRVKGRFALRH